MRLSLAYEMQRPVVDGHAVIKETLEQCVLADRMGFDTVCFVFKAACALDIQVSTSLRLRADE